MSSNRDVSIGVKVDGAGKAKRDLRSVASEARKAGAAGDAGQRTSQGVTKADHNQARAKGKVAKATGKAAKAQDQFNDSAKTAITGVLGQFSPTLASIGNIAVDVAKGVGGISTALLGMVGAGAAIGGIVMLFQHFAEAARKLEETMRRADEARKKQRNESLGAEGQVTEALAKAGVRPDANIRREVRSRVREMALRHDVSAIPAGYAQSGLIAQMLGGLSNEQMEQFIAGMAASGEGPVEFGRDQAANKRAITEHLRLGGKDGAAEFASEYFAGLRQATRRGAAAPDDGRRRERQHIDTEVSVLAKQHPGLSDEELEAIRLRAVQASGGPFELRPKQHWRMKKASKAFDEDARSRGIPRTFEELAMGVLTRVEDVERQRGREAVERGAGDQQPVIIHHHHYTNTTNIDTHYGELPGSGEENRGRMAADLITGTGVWN